MAILLIWSIYWIWCSRIINVTVFLIVCGNSTVHLEGYLAYSIAWTWVCLSNSPQWIVIREPEIQDG